MIESILFKGISVLMPEGFREGDVFVKAGKIAEIGASVSSPAEQTISGKGLAVFPGVIDPHVHFRDPGLTWKEDLESGSRAAAAGGVTSFFDMPNTQPSTTTVQLMAEKKQIAAEKSLVNYNFFIGATADNIDELNTVENVPGIKLYMGPSTGELLVDDTATIARLFAQAKPLIAIHAEDGHTITENKAKYGTDTIHNHYKIRSAEAAKMATETAISLSKKYNKRIHICHVTTGQEAAMLMAEKNNPLISGEVTPQHLLLFAPNIYDEIGTYAQMNPPIREREHGVALFKALINGGIACIGTDHAPHSKEEKDAGFGKAPSGMPGVETSLSLLLTLAAQGQITYHQLTEWLCHAPARLFNIENKGFLKAGFDADLAIVDLNARKTLSNETTISKCGWTPFNGREVTGIPILTVVNGQIVYREGDFFEEIKGKEIKIRRI